MLLQNFLIMSILGGTLYVHGKTWCMDITTRLALLTLLAFPQPAWHFPSQKHTPPPTKRCNMFRKPQTKNLCDKDFAELSGELSGAICLKSLFYWVLPSNCSDKSLVLFLRFFGFGVLFWLLNRTHTERRTRTHTHTHTLIALGHTHTQHASGSHILLYHHAFDTRVLKTHRHAVYQCFSKKPPTRQRFQKASISTRACNTCPFLNRRLLPI